MLLQPHCSIGGCVAVVCHVYARHSDMAARRGLEEAAAVQHLPRRPKSSSTAGHAGCDQVVGQGVSFWRQVGTLASIVQHRQLGQGRMTHTALYRPNLSGENPPPLHYVIIHPGICIPPSPPRTAQT